MSIVKQLKVKRNDFIAAYNYQPNALMIDSKTWEKLVSECGYSVDDSQMFSKKDGKYGQFTGMKIKLVNDENEFISVALTEETI